MLRKYGGIIRREYSFCLSVCYNILVSTMPYTLHETTIGEKTPLLSLLIAGGLFFKGILTVTFVICKTHSHKRVITCYSFVRFTNLKTSSWVIPAFSFCFKD